MDWCEISTTNHTDLEKKWKVESTCFASTLFHQHKQETAANDIIFFKSLFFALHTHSFEYDEKGSSILMLLSTETSTCFSQI